MLISLYPEDEVRFYVLNQHTIFSNFLGKRTIAVF